MGNKDLTEKILEDYNDVFADIVNVLLFQGEKEVNPDTLSNASVHSQYKDSEGKLHEEERDVAKFWNDSNVTIALYGIENQTKVENRMPLRIFGYEGASYREQLTKEAAYPVVTIVLYFGTEKRWTGPKTLKELFTIPNKLKPFVNDLKINVFEIAWLPDDMIAKFTSDFKVVANFFSQKRKNSDYIPDDKTELIHVDEVLKLLSAMTGDNRYETIMVQGKEKVSTMCEVAERLENKGRAAGLTEGLTKGREEGRAEGRAEGLTEGRAEGRAEGLTEGRAGLIAQILRNGKSPEQIADLCGIDVEEVKEIEKNMK